MQKKLSQWVEEDPNRRIKDLYSLLCNEEWLRVAHKRVNTNSGRHTAGIDRITMWHFNENLDANLETLREQLKAKTFEPMPVRRVYIPKANGKKRPLGIPTIHDRIVQEALRMILEPIWEACFSLRSYGFRPNRSTYDAVSYITTRLVSHHGESYQWVIEGDITSYFDTIPHRRLIKAVKKKVADKDIRNLLWQFLRAGVMEQGTQRETLTGTPQGGIVSPLLANIYLHELDGYMESKYLSLSTYNRLKRRKQGKGNYFYVRYADDFVVLCNGTKADAQGLKEELATVLLQMGLTLSEEKTKVTHITEGFDFLGYRIKKGIGTSGKMVPQVFIPDNAIKKYRHKLREILAPSSTKESVNVKIKTVNRLTRGWCQYYRITHRTDRGFDSLRKELFDDMTHWLGRKYKISKPEIMRRFRKDNTFGTEQVSLVMPTEYLSKKMWMRTWHNPYTGTEGIEREDLFSYDEFYSRSEQRPGWSDRKEEVYLLKGNTCSLCGKTLRPGNKEVDHIRPRAQFKETSEADSMDNLQIMCKPCHRAKTKTDRC
jgi:group II intron reverse transcriptase/maturase